MTKAARVIGRKLVASATRVTIMMAVGAGPLPAQHRLPVDRWLISSAFRADTAEKPLEHDYLTAPGEAAVLPDRGRTVYGADWVLVREDGATVFHLPTHVEIDAEPPGDTVPDSSAEETPDSTGVSAEDPATGSDRSAGAARSRLGPAAAAPEAGHRDGPDQPVVAYAHAYIRAPEDRTVRLLWGGVDCTRVEAWLNGRPVNALGRPGGDLDRVVHSFSADVRIGFGYNTLLVKALSGDCEFGIAAALEEIQPDGLQGIRVQASRPYGDTRTGPQPWVVAESDGGPEPILGWKGDRLFGAAGARLAAFAVTPVERVRVKAKVGGQAIEREIDWLTPGEQRLVMMPFEFERLRRAVLAGEGVDLELKWDEGESQTGASLDPDALLDGLHSSIRLLGWRPPEGTEPEDQPAVVEAGDPAGDPHPLAYLIPLPTEGGQVLLGEWKVPGWLEGFTLRLDAEGAGGSYRIDSREVEGESIALCDPCQKGQTLRIEVRTSGPWNRFPGAVLVGLDRPPTDGTPVDAARWLRLLDQNGSREYRERAVATASQRHERRASR